MEQPSNQAAPRTRVAATTKPVGSVGSTTPASKPKFVLPDRHIASLPNGGVSAVEITGPTPASPCSDETVAPKIPIDAGFGSRAVSGATQPLAESLGKPVVSNTSPQKATTKTVVDGGGIRLLNALWRSPAKAHQIGGLNRKTKWFTNTPVKNVIDALARAQSMSGAGIDPYFAPAEYRTPNSRTATNVAGAYAFWVDLDVGPDKAKDCKGYATIADAQAAVRKFCIEAGLSYPTNIVHSGSGLHCYWVLDDFLDRETWLAHAVKLKAIAKKFGFLADPSRTSDPASVMRLPQTMNLKYVPPRPVTLAFSSEKFIANAVLLQAINAAFARLESDQINAVQTVVKVEGNAPVSAMPNTSDYGPPDLERLASALAWLTPDCDDYTWKFDRLAPLARVAREYPALAAQAYALAKCWSSGELGDKPSKKWVTPSASDGRIGERSFEVQWKRFLKPNPGGKETSIGTIYYDAEAAGWTPAATMSNDKPAALVVTQLQANPMAQPLQVASASGDKDPALAAMQAKFGLLNLGGKLCVFDRTSLESRTDQGAAQRLLLSSRSDGALLIKRALKAAFPLLDDPHVLETFWVSPQTACYAGVDFNPNGVSANYLNLWVGPTIVPKAGNWPLIKCFFLEVICAGDEGHFQYLLKYIAHALQYPEKKPGIIVILISGQGTGKGTMARVLQRIWTATFLQVSDMSAITGSFNAALERTYIVWLDEALFAGDHRASDALKSLVTEPTILINEKHQPLRQVHSFHRFFVATNASHLKSTDRDDRRDFSLRVSEARKGDTAYWQALYRELETGGIEAMVHDLLAMDLSEFNVRVRPNTNELLEQKLQSLEPIPRWWYECLCDGELAADGTWSNFIATDTVITSVVGMAGSRLFRKPSGIDVVRVFKALCPSASKGQRKDNWSRKRGLNIPSLELARTEFDQYIGAQVKW